MADLPSARHLLEQGQLAEADAALRHRLQTAPPSAETHYLLGYVLFRERKAADSLAEYTAAALLRTPTAEELTIVASDYILLKDYPDAEHWLLFTTTRTPDDPTAWYLLGRTQYNQDHAREAIASFQRCLGLRPRDARAEYNLGLAYEKTQQPETAISAFQTAIEWQRQDGVRDPQPFLNLGMLFLAQQQPEKALSPLREAVTEGPRNALANQELGLALEGVGRLPEAVAALRRAKELAPEAEQPHFLLGRVYRRLGRTNDATAEFSAVAQLAASHSGTETPNIEDRP